MKIKILILIFINLQIIIFSSLAIPPDEGMWLPLLLKRLNYEDMQKKGLRLSAEELYSINSSSIKDAVVMLNGGECTSEIISEKGLLLTNHHCAYSAIQSHSTLQHNYLEDGFWAKNYSEELPNEGMTASILIRIEDVTRQILKEVGTETSASERANFINQAIENIEKEAADGGKYETTVKSFFEGNEYYLFVYITYRDIRLVGAPPSSIGKFGGDTDNWMWPRHTGDFSLMRIYAAPDGSPADYSTDNIPLKPRHYFKVSVKGYKPDDFAMIWGFPGSTERYLSSEGTKLLLQQTASAIIAIRDKKLQIMKSAMDADPVVKIKYASKYASVSNYWKYYIGQCKGLKRLNIVEKKKLLEDSFLLWIEKENARKLKYANVIKDINEAYSINFKELHSVRDTYFQELIIDIDVLNFIFSLNYKGLNSLIGEKNNIELKNQLIQTTEDFYKNFDPATDKKMFIEMFQMYYNNLPPEYYPDFFNKVKKKFKNDFNRYADYVYKKSIFMNKDNLKRFFAKPSEKILKSDPLVETYNSFLSAYFELYVSKSISENKLQTAKRLFIEGQREMNNQRVFYPDANSTLRCTYGKVSDYIPADAVHFNYYTTAKGIIEKEDKSNEEFIVPSKLQQLINNKDFGDYGKNGNINICFITNTDITGGNSGSPVLDAEGNLIGIAFDGNWEAMSGDIAYEPALQRTINVDIRYVLFVIDKFAGANNIIKELKFLR
ncbi:MAG: S46 family peptidase [Bacteroidales bacterium]|nr:S46 family peptidase [Bacteroidales bacterium]